MELIQINVDGQEFKFKAIPSLLEQSQIKSEMASILKKGYDELLDMEDSTSKAYQAHLKHNEDIYGTEESAKMMKRYFELTKIRRNAKEEEKKVTDEEYVGLANKICNNAHFQRFLDWCEVKEMLENLATMRVTCIYPQNYDWKKLGEDATAELRVVNAYVEKKNLLKRSKD